VDFEAALRCCGALRPILSDTVCLQPDGENWAAAVSAVRRGMASSGPKNRSITLYAVVRPEAHGGSTRRELTAFRHQPVTNLGAQSLT
jgi:hypothetical protein